MKEHLFLAFNNLRRRKLRSWLTVLGIFIGIAAVVSLISLGQGLQNFIGVQFEQIGGNTIIIQPKTIGPPGSATDEKVFLDSKDLEIIKKIKGVEKAEGSLILTGVVKKKQEQEVVMINGLSEKYLEMFGDKGSLEIIEGRQLKDTDNSKAVVGYNHFFGNLWDSKLKLREDIEINGKNFEVVGVLKKQGNPFDDNSVWIEKETFSELFGVDDEDMILAKTKKGENPEEVAESIKKELRKKRNEKIGQETFTVHTSSQLFQTFSDIFLVVQTILVGIAAISLLVGGIGIMNTMYTSVIERTKEIGTMKAIGAKNSDIFLIFLFESGLLGLVGGVIGVLIGVGIGKGIEYIALVQFGTPFLQAIFGFPLILGALAFSFIIGALSGTLPAIQAAQLKPADALRYE